MQFNVGDRVVCLEEYQRGYVGREATVVLEYLSGTRSVLRVLFDGDERSKAWYSYRFQLVEDGMEPLSVVCRKIRQMEKRWIKYQERKAA